MAALTTTTSSLLALLAAALALLAAALALLAPAPTYAQQLPGNILITGTVPCTVNPPPSPLPLAPVFPYASVLLQCGKQVISRTTSNVNGAFALVMSSDGNPVTMLLQLLDGCKLLIPTPLSVCNASLPNTGSLQSPLQLLSGGFLGFLFKLVPSNFSFTNL